MKLRRLFVSSLGFIALVVIWEVLAAANVYNTRLLPPPSQAVIAIVGLAKSGVLASDLVASLQRYIPGFIIGTIIGVLAGIVTGISKLTKTVVDPVFHYLKAIPPVALVPFMLVIFGVGEVGRVSLVAWACVFPVWLSTQAGISQTPIEYLQAAKIYRANLLVRIFEVWLPSSAPYVLNGLRIAVSTGLFALAASEMFAASSGVAYRIVYSHQLFQTDTMVGMILVLGVFAVIGDRLLLLLRKLTVRGDVRQ